MLTIVMFVFVGAVEELIFRCILQTRLEKALGLKSGILLSGALFGIMHSSYGILNEILFASIFGIILGFIFQRTRSFPFILLIHGCANVLLFGIFPTILT
jgi:membrane protease YdiL (CAAX protease family)